MDDEEFRNNSLQLVTINYPCKLFHLKYLLEKTYLQRSYFDKSNTSTFKFNKYDYLHYITCLFIPLFLNVSFYSFTFAS